ncbi:MAG: RteC domain-containing protein [Bacteroidota bacterium]|nr:RteC domain-containing protein [Bacteroidota bacterium]MDP3145394.1 RteC domain-containing protein [Bacteroidota bacterium]MDP3557587.1 RteC domain-containing protein [Bacteroidota bacterium]
MKKLLEELHKNLHFLSLEQDNTIKLCEEGVRICNRALEQCKKYLTQKEFKTKAEEIKFFKELKPVITSKLKYYHLVFKVENGKPQSEEAQKLYYEKELASIDNYFQSNIEFITYYKTGNEYMDVNYFTRSNTEVNLMADDNYYLSDKKFSTPYDSKVALMIAYELLAIYIRNEIKKIEKRAGMEPIKPYYKTLVWTDSKVSLVELIYALHISGCFNRGTLEIKELAETISEIFHIDIGDFYRTWAEIKSRKDTTKFLDALKTTLDNKIKEDFK